MTAFSKLHPTLQHHIVNTLGWRELRPLQESSIVPILEHNHVLLLAPTAGGKTESAFFPVLSRMLSENWDGLGVLYLCPLKALINNLHTRLEGYCRWAGRRCELWHGDVSQASRRKLLRDLPDCLLTTPESLEVMLISPNTDKRLLFGGLRAVIVDEIHSFAGDDRGWHLLSVLERIKRISGREPQRVGLSATVGNPQGLIDWLAGHCEGPRLVVQVSPSGAIPPKVEVDFVGSLDNAATVISRMHQGEKRLVFCDSRSRVEKLAGYLRGAGVETQVSHSSLSLDERRRAETAFAESSNCVIVATSTLELGIDVGDLDRVIQIDSPTTVSSFLQRLGRSGRRAGGVRNCLFLATHPDALLRAVAVLKLWQEGFVEPIEPPPAPYHVFVQQIFALALQEKGLGRNAWREWLMRLPPFANAPAGLLDEIVRHLVQTGYLSEDQGVFFIGHRGEKEFGFQYFLELFSVFMRDPEFEVYFGREHLGSVDLCTFASPGKGPSVLSLAGRSWKVRDIDWSGRKTFVEPADGGGVSRWLGGGKPYSFVLCQAIKEILANDASFSFLSRRGKEALQTARTQPPWITRDGTVLRTDSSDGCTEWWTFAGRKANAHLAKLLQHTTNIKAKPDNLSLRLERAFPGGSLVEAISDLRSGPKTNGDTGLNEEQKTLKFSECLPAFVLSDVLRQRQDDGPAIEAIFKQPVTLFSELSG